MNKFAKGVFITTGILTGISAIVLPIGFVNINRIRSEAAQITNNIETTGPNVNQVPSNPHLSDPNFCEGWIPCVTAIITVNALAFILTIIIIIYLIYRKKYHFSADISDL